MGLLNIGSGLQHLIFFERDVDDSMGLRPDVIMLGHGCSVLRTV